MAVKKLREEVEIKRFEVEENRLSLSVPDTGVGHASLGRSTSDSFGCCQ